MHALLVVGASVAPAVLSAATGQDVEGMTGAEPHLPVVPPVVAATAMLVLGGTVRGAVGGSPATGRRHRPGVAPLLDREHGDTIVVMGAGTVIDAGPHPVLMERCPLYRGLYDIQASTFR